MSSRRLAVLIACALVLVAGIASGVAQPPPTWSGDDEVIRGTVERFRPGILSLTDVRLPGGESAARPVMVIVNGDTAYFDGALRTTKESVTKGVKVLIRCRPAGTGRLAVVVRIVAGMDRDR